MFVCLFSVEQVLIEKSFKRAFKEKRILSLGACLES